MRNTDINQFVGTRSKRPQGAGEALGTTGFVIRKFFGIVLKTFLAVVLVGVVTGIIVGASLAMYVVSLMGTEADIDLSVMKLNQTSFVYNTDAEGKVKEHVRLHGTENRVWVDLAGIPTNMRNAVIAVEDERFMTHKGVDWQRTLAAGANLFNSSSTSTFGASTITQQLIKNRTGEDDISLNRKITEIFKALNLETRFSKDEILESYLNVIALGNGCNGVQAAANTYFGKNVKDLTLAECASIAGITQNPSKFNPLRNRENNKKRQETVLYMMKQNGLIDESEYQAAMSEKLVFKQKEKTKTAVPIWDYYVDLIIEDVIADMANEKGLTRQAATDTVFGGGLKIYSAVDTKMQGILEDVFYNNNKKLPKDKTLQCATIVVDYKGRVLGTIGGRGAKPINRSLNRSTQSRRQPGSSIKPLSAYAPGIEYNFLEWSSPFSNQMLHIKGVGDWPKNSNRTYSNRMLVQNAIQISSNCVAARVVQLITPQRSFDFLTNNLGFTSVEKPGVDEKTGKALKNDVNLSALATGGMTYGVTVREMSAGYAIFGNGGKYYKPYTYYKITDSINEKEAIIDNIAKEPIQAVSEGTSSEMNKLLQTVVKPGGTARTAGVSGFTIFGKTGTTSDNKDRWFVGGTPLCVAAVWVGYDEPASISSSSNPCVPVWNEIMGRYHKGMAKKDFSYPGITTKKYCTVTGGLAQNYCYSTAVGWFKRKGGAVKKCNGDHSMDMSGSYGSGSSGSSAAPPSSSKDPSSKDPSSKQPPSTPSTSTPSKPPSSVPPKPPSSSSSRPVTSIPGSSDETGRTTGG